MNTSRTIQINPYTFLVINLFRICMPYFCFKNIEIIWSKNICLAIAARFIMYFQLILQNLRKSWVHGNGCTVTLWKPIFSLSSLDGANCSVGANYLYSLITDTTNTGKTRRTQAVSHRKYNPQAQIKQDWEQLIVMLDIRKMTISIYIFGGILILKIATWSYYHYL